MKPRCSSIQRYLSDYIDCTLSGRQTVLVAQHLRTCGICRRELESLKCTKRLLSFYIQPTFPGEYEDRFWRQLQRTIEKHPRPLWWRAHGLWALFTWRCENLLSQLSCFLVMIFSPLIRRVRYSPVYASILSAIIISFLVYHTFQPQEPVSSDTTNLRNALRVYPIHLMPVQADRELIRNREKAAEVSPSFPKEFARESRRLSRRLDTVEVTAGNLKWEGYISRFVSDNDALLAAISRDAGSDAAIFAQLSNPEFIAAREDFSPPPGIVITPAPAKVERSSRQLSGFIEKLTDVQLPSLSITEIYDSVKL